MILSIILSIIAAVLSLTVVLTHIREFGNRMVAAIRDQDYYWDGNGITTVIGIIALILWVIVAHLN
jgi:hypothetical protein